MCVVLAVFVATVQFECTVCVSFLQSLWLLSSLSARYVCRVVLAVFVFCLQTVAAVQFV